LLLLTQLLFAAELILFPLVMRAYALAGRRYTHVKTCAGLLSVAGAYAALRLLTWILYYATLRFRISAIENYRGGRPPEPPKALIWITIIFLWLGTFALVGYLIWYLLAIWKSRRLAHP
jgi:hypothetical protein